MGHFEQFGRKEARSPTTVRQGGIGANKNATNRGQITLLVCSGRSGGWVGVGGDLWVREVDVGLVMCVFVYGWVGGASGGRGRNSVMGFVFKKKSVPKKQVFSKRDQRNSNFGVEGGSKSNKCIKRKL